MNSKTACFMDGCGRMGEFVKSEDMNNVPGLCVVTYRPFGSFRTEKISNIPKGLLITINRNQIGGVSTFPVYHIVAAGADGYNNFFGDAIKETVDAHLHVGLEASKTLSIERDVRKLLDAERSQSAYSEIQSDADKLKKLQVGNIRKDDRGHS